MSHEPTQADLARDAGAEYQWLQAEPSRRLVAELCRAYVFRTAKAEGGDVD